MKVIPDHPVATIVAAPFIRLGETPAWAKVWTVVVAAATATFGDMFLGLFLLLCMTSWADWVIGKRAARMRRGQPPHVDYSVDLAHLGMHSKASGLVLVLFIYALSLWARAHLAFNAEGWISLGPVVVAFAFVLQDLDSIEEHRLRMGGGPVPVLSRLLALLRAIPERMLKTPEAAPKNETPSNRP